MATIEERAAERYEDPQEPYCFETDREQQWYRCGECDGYIAGATEQDRISRAEERERCILMAQKYACRNCLNEGVCDGTRMCTIKNNIRKAIEEGVVS